MQFWSIKGVYFFKNANVLNFELFFGCFYNAHLSPHPKFLQKPRLAAGSDYYYHQLVSYYYQTHNPTTSSPRGLLGSKSTQRQLSFRGPEGRLKKRSVASFCLAVSDVLRSCKGALFVKLLSDLCDLWPDSQRATTTTAGDEIRCPLRPALSERQRNK